MNADITDRSSWPAGPWHAEPFDREQWTTAAGLPGLIHRGPLGAWCGYVAVPPGHPWHGVHYGGCGQRPECGGGWLDCRHSPEELIDVHGGLTYSDHCQGSICHVPAPGEPDDVWWFGFDCAHAGDAVPEMLRYMGDSDDTYRDAAYVRVEVERLAVQLAEVAP